MTTLNNQQSHCLDCIFYLSYDRVIGICRNENNEHYQHVLHHNHLSCGVLDTDDTIDDMLSNIIDDFLIQYLNEERILGRS